MFYFQWKIIDTLQIQAFWTLMYIFWEMMQQLLLIVELPKQLTSKLSQFTQFWVNWVIFKSVYFNQGLEQTSFFYHSIATQNSLWRKGNQFWNVKVWKWQSLELGSIIIIFWNFVGLYWFLSKFDQFLWFFK